MRLLSSKAFTSALIPRSPSHSLKKFMVSSEVGDSDRAKSRIVPIGSPFGIVRSPSSPFV